MYPRTNFTSDSRFAADFRIAVDAIQDELVYLPRPLPPLLSTMTGYISADDQERWLYTHASCFRSEVTGEANPLRGNLLAFAALASLAATLATHGPPQAPLIALPPPRPGLPTTHPRQDPTNLRDPYPNSSDVQHPRS